MVILVYDKKTWSFQSQERVSDNSPHKYFTYHLTCQISNPLFGNLVKCDKREASQKLLVEASTVKGSHCDFLQCFQTHTLSLFVLSNRVKVGTKSTNQLHFEILFNEILSLIFKVTTLTLMTKMTFYPLFESKSQLIIIFYTNLY